MFTKRPTPSTKLTEAIDALLARIAEEPYDPKETPVLVDQVTKLTKLTETNSPKPISGDILVTAAAHLVGIVLILQYERLNVVTSKALGFVMRLR